MDFENIPVFILLIAACYLLIVNLLLNLAQWIARTHKSTPRSIATVKQRS
jgi:hypothetical protein